jgi:hypothetical protein
VRRALALAVAALSAWPGPAGAAPRAKPRGADAADPPAAAGSASAAPIKHGPKVGAVVHVTALRAYLDAGTAQGLAPGKVLRLLRGGALAATCEVETAARRHATCRPDGAARRGDLFPVTPAAVAEPPAPKPLPRVLPPEELDRRAEAVAAQPQDKVEAKTAPAAMALPSGRRGEVGYAHASWSSTGQQPWQEERLDAAIRGAEVWDGITLHVDLQAVHWTARPATFRMQPPDRSRLYVWEAALAQRDPRRDWTGALGRVVPWTIPGATPFDGLQLGLAPSGRRGEVGVFGGLVPDPVTLSPTAERSTAGAYGSLSLGSGPVIARTDARAAVVTSPELGTRMEGELRSFALLGRTVNAEGLLRLGVGGKHQAPNAIDLAQVDLSGRPVPKLLVSGLFRYAGLSVPDAAAPAVYPGIERRADGAVGYEVGPALVSASGGWGKDLASGLERAWLGPEVAFPRLFGPRGGASLGYAAEWGWIGGRTAWIQAAVRPAPRLRLDGRLTWTEDFRAGGDSDHALGLLAAVNADVGRWVTLRASVLGRLGATATPAGFTGSAAGLTALLGIASRF